MLTIFWGPFRDTTEDAFQSIENAPGLIIDVGGQRRRYAQKLIAIFKESWAHEPSPLQLKLSSWSVTIGWGEFAGHEEWVRLEKMVDILYPPSSPNRRENYHSNPNKVKRIPELSLFRIGG